MAMPFDALTSVLDPATHPFIKLLARVRAQCCARKQGSNNLASADLRSAYNREVPSIASANVNTPTRWSPVIGHSYHTDLRSCNESASRNLACTPILLFLRETSIAEKRFARSVRKIRTSSLDQHVTFLRNKGSLRSNKLFAIFRNGFTLISNIWSTHFVENCLEYFKIFLLNWWIRYFPFINMQVEKILHNLLRKKRSNNILLDIFFTCTVYNTKCMG